MCFNKGVRAVGCGSSGALSGRTRRADQGDGVQRNPQTPSALGGTGEDRRGAGKHLQPAWSPAPPPLAPAQAPSQVYLCQRVWPTGMPRRTPAVFPAEHGRFLIVPLLLDSRSPILAPMNREAWELLECLQAQECEVGTGCGPGGAAGSLCRCSFVTGRDNPLPERLHVGSSPRISFYF